MRLTLRSSGPRTSLVLITGGLALRVILGNWGWDDVWPALLLLVAWSGVEWCVHYYLLHGNRFPVLGIRPPLFLRQMHDRHHRDPWDHATLHFKGATILVAWCAVTSAMFWMFGLGPAISFSTVLFLLVEVYQWVHLLVHSKVPVSSVFMRDLVRSHVLHHVRDGRRWMGVTTTLADRILGTDSARHPLE